MERYIKTEDAIPYLTRYIPSVEAVERSKIDKAIEEIEFLRQHRAKYITEDNKICIDSGEVLKIMKNIGE